VIGLVWIVVRSPLTRKAGLIVAAISAYILASALIHEGGWWARFAPQLYFIPVLIALFLVSVREKWANFLGSVVVITLMLNTAMIGGSYVYRNIKVTYALNDQFAQLAREEQPLQAYFGRFQSTGTRLSEAGVQFDEVSSVERLSCAHPREIVHATGSFVCP
jgi:hypothetical protein